MKSIDDVRSLVVATRGLSVLTDPSVLAAKACRRMHEMTAADLSILALVTDEGLEIVSWVGTDEDCAGLRAPRGAGMGWRCLERDMPVTTGDCTADAGTDAVAAVAARAGMQGLAAVPVRLDDHDLGVLFAGRRNTRVVPRVTLLLGEFAASLAPLVVTAHRAQSAGEHAVEAERQRIAQDLHDTAGQMLFKISMSARELHRSAHEADDVQEIARTIETDAAEASSYLRAAMSRLTPSGTALPVTIRRDVATFGSRTGIATELAVFGSPHPASPQAESVLLAVVREALHNVGKHAGADAVFVSLSYRPDGIGLIVEDDGKGLPAGFDLNPVPGRGVGLGLSGLLQKVAGVAGTLEISTNDDGGTTVRATIPRAS
ncbi:MAG: histidine kinase [Actinomycetota bacterium]|nr:histidine kinase [Actinomycetota bacterium]